MPQDSPMAKVDATRNYGAQVELVGAGFDESMAAAQAFVDSTGATFVHAFEDERVIAGQGTIGLELVEQLPDFGTLVVPIGGGGLAAGIAIALRGAQARRADRRRPGRERLPVRRRHRAPLHDRRGDRGQAARDAHVRDPRASCSTRSSPSPTSRSATRSCSCSSGRSCSSRAPAPRRSPRCSRARCPGRTRRA